MRVLTDKTILTPAEWQEIRANKTLRTEIAKRSLYWFFHIYFHHYIEYPTADFQRELFNLIGDDNIEHLVTVAFRGSGKSTIATTAFPLWSIIGEKETKFVVIVSQTQAQARQHLRNLRLEMEKNELFRNDFGRLEEESDEWGIASLVLPLFGAKITAVSRDQSIRGARFGAHRPQLIISDDIEDTASVKTMENRKATESWFTSEILALGSKKTRFITIGNLLHEDSLLMRLIAKMEAGELNGRYVRYPIMVGRQPLWPGQFPDYASVAALKRRIANHVTWEREYMLRIVPDDDQLVTRSMIKYYDELPLERAREGYVMGVDVAISERETADRTALVSLLVTRSGDDSLLLYVMPDPINKRLTFRKTIDEIRGLQEGYSYDYIFVENNGYQGAVAESLQEHGIDAIGIPSHGDKRTRLSTIAAKIESGQIRFPRAGCKELIEQLVGFGVEKHDDLVDALTLAVRQTLQRKDDFVPVRIAGVHIDIYGGSVSLGGGRNYWDDRLDDWEEATSDK